MAILQVSYDKQTHVALLQPVGAPVPEGYEDIGKTYAGVTFFAAVQALLIPYGILNMSAVTIAFDSLHWADQAPIKDKRTVAEKAAGQPKSEPEGKDETELPE